MRKRKIFLTGFTLLELIIVLVIIGILAGIAVPNYTKMKERVLGDEAIANLKLISAAEKVYRLEDAGQAYVTCKCQTPNECEASTGLFKGCNIVLKLKLVTENWQYGVDATTIPGSFKAVANRQGTAGYLDCVYTMTNTDTEPVKGESCP